MQDFILQSEQYLKKIKTYIINMVAQMMEQELPVLTEEKFALFEISGNRLIYEKEYFAKRKFLTVFGVAAQWMKLDKSEALGAVSKQAVIKKLEEIMFSICAEECWALPAHVNRKEDANWRNTIDLFSAETAQSLADIVKAVGGDLSSQCVERVRENVQYRVLQPFFETPINTNNWEQVDHNWNAVCNGSIGSAYLHSLGNGEEPNRKYLERICENLVHYIDGFAEDGTCMEGLGYYFYGMTYMVNFANELYQASGGVIDLLRGNWGSFCAGEEDKRARIACWWSKCYFNAGRTVSFSDGDSRDKYRMGLACTLAERFSAVHIPSVKQALLPEEDFCYRYLPLKMDMFCTLHYLEELKKQQSGIQTATYENSLTETQQGRINLLKDAQWCIGQANLSTAGFACKGGHNGEPHNHNDVGSFLYVAGKDMFLVDLGAGEYTKAYFSEDRYNILCNRSMGHNVPLIANREQLTGTVYACKSFEAAETSREICVSMNLTKAYDVEQLKCYTRKIIFDKEDGTLTVEDYFECTEEITITENLVTQYLPEMEGHSIILLGEEGVCYIQITKTNKKSTDLPKVISMEHSNHQGVKEKVYLIQWDRKVKGSQKESFRIEKI